VANIPPRGLHASQVTQAVITDLGMHGRQSAGFSKRRLVQSVLNLGKNRTAPEFCRTKTDPVNTHVYSGTGQATR
jgi:hypothetical protein